MMRKWKRSMAVSMAAVLLGLAVLPGTANGFCVEKVQKANDSNAESTQTATGSNAENVQTATGSNAENIQKATGSNTMARVIAVNTCSNPGNRMLAADGDTDTFWTSKDSHKQENRHYIEFILDREYTIERIEMHLGRLTNGKWGFIPENLRVEARTDGEYDVVLDQNTVTEMTFLTLPEPTKASSLRLSFLDSRSKGFSVREVAFYLPGQPGGQTQYSQKKVYADYHGPRYTREHDGNVGNWGFVGEAKNSGAANKKVINNPDVIGEDGRRKLAAAAYPLVGMQSQMDPDYHEYQILLAKMANIDGFFVEWGFPGHGSDRQLEIMMETADKYGFELGINWCDAWHMKDWITLVKPEVVTREEKVAEAVNSLSEILEKLYASNCGALFEGHPLVYLFGGGFDKAEVRKIVEEAVIPGQFLTDVPWYFRRASVSGSVNSSDQVNYSYAGTDWHTVVDGPYGWVPERVRSAQAAGFKDFDVYGTREDAVSYLQMLKRTFINNPDIPLRNSVVSPGMDNRPCAGWGDKFKYMDRDEGQLYRDMWEFNVLNRDYLDVVYIASWNDYTEGHQIEPTVEDGYRELFTTQDFAYQFKGKGSQDKTGFSLPLRLFELRKEAEKLEAMGGDAAALNEQLDQAGRDISEGRYEEAGSLLNEVQRVISAEIATDSNATILCNEANGKLVLTEQIRENVAYRKTVTSNCSKEGLASVVDGVSDTAWSFEGVGSYIDIDIGSNANLVAGVFMGDMPFRLYYWEEEVLKQAEVVRDAGNGFYLPKSVTASRVRIQLEASQGNVYEIKLYANSVPDVEVVSPQPNGQVDFTAPWQVEVEASDRDGSIVRVEAWLDGILMTPLSVNPTDSRYSLLLPPAEPTLHQLTVKVVDNEGGYTVAGPFSLYPILENIALNKPAIANVSMQGYGPELAVDGIISLDSRWRTPASYTEHWLEIDLEGTYEICRADLFMGDLSGYAVRDFKLEYWDGSGWRQIPGTSFTGNTVKDMVLRFDPIITNKVRFYSSEAAGRGVRVKEIMIYAPAKATGTENCASINFHAKYLENADSGGGAESLSAAKGCYLTLSDEVAQQLSGKYYEGILSFEYLDDGFGSFSVLVSADGQAEFGNYEEAAVINKTGTGQWMVAKINLKGPHIRMNHTGENDSDVALKGPTRIRGISLEFVVAEPKL